MWKNIYTQFANTNTTKEVKTKQTAENYKSTHPEILHLFTALFTPYSSTHLLLPNHRHPHKPFPSSHTHTHSCKRVTWVARSQDFV